jgi:hypothetical protein
LLGRPFVSTLIPSAPHSACNLARVFTFCEPPELVLPFEQRPFYPQEAQRPESFNQLEVVSLRPCRQATSCRSDSRNLRPLFNPPGDTTQESLLFLQDR